MARIQGTARTIENEAAYEAAIRRRIRENAAKSKRAAFMANPENVALIDALGVHARPGNFFDKMLQSFIEWGSLTDNQAAACRRIISEKTEKKEAAIAARKAEDAASSHVGTVKERRTFTVTIRQLMAFEGMYGTTWIHICKDSDGNVIVYKGTTVLGDKGETVTVKATVKEHGYRDGVAQTVIARPAK